MMNGISFDALIIGAGAAGLAAAAELAEAGASALAIEARDRIGGRVWSHHEPELSVPVEFGAEFIHGRPPVTFSLLKSAGLNAIEAPFVRHSVRRGKLQAATDDYLAEMQPVLRTHADALAKKDVSFKTFLSWCGHDLSKGARAFARMRVQGYDAADPARVSARAIVQEWIRDDADQGGHFRPQGGYGALMNFLAGAVVDSGVRLRLKTIVHTLRWKHGSVVVEGTSEGAAFRATATRAIVTLPLGVLQMPPEAPGAVRFSPTLAEKEIALSGLVSGSVIKTALRFHHSFWEDLDDGRYRHATVFRTPRAVFPGFRC